MFWMYAGFVAPVLVLLALDLGVFHREAHVVKMKEALGWSAFWIVLGLAFAVFIYFGYENHWLGLGLTPDMVTVAPQTVEGVGTVYNDGSSATVKYITGYLVEKSLAVDNIFVIAMLFAFFAVPAVYQHRVLFWGIVGILAGLAILATEFIWARALHKRMKPRAAALMPATSDPRATHAASTAAGGSLPSPPCRP